MENYISYIKNVRKELHKIPEVSFKEFKTSEFIKKELSNYDCFELHNFAQTGIVAEYKVNDNPYIAFRCDMDALPILEETEAEFKSEHEGCMHACGHDVHMALMLGFAKYIADEKPNRNIILIFQPAEEGLGGAEHMIKEGLLDKFNVEEIFALHTSPDFLVGTLGVNRGKMFAGATEFVITLNGKGGHAAFPHLINDVITAGTNLVVQLQTIIPRFVNPVNENVLSIGCIQSGFAANVIPENFVIKGTFRSYKKDEMMLIKKKMDDMCKNTASSYDISYNLDIISEYVPAINNPKSAEKIEKLDGLDGIEVIECEPKMTGEDFGFFLEKINGAIFWLGVRKDGEPNYGLHNPKYLPNEDSFKYAFSVFKSLI